MLSVSMSAVDLHPGIAGANARDGHPLAGGVEANPFLRCHKHQGICALYVQRHKLSFVHRSRLGSMACGGRVRSLSSASHIAGTRSRRFRSHCNVLGFDRSSFQQSAGSGRTGRVNYA